MVDDGPAKSVSIVVLSDDPATAAALEHAISTQHLAVTLFVEPNAIGGLTPDDSVTIGLAEDRTAVRLTKPWERRRKIINAASALTVQFGTAPQYLLPRGNRGNLYEVALLPRHARLLGSVEGVFQAVSPGVRLVDTHGLTSAEAVAAVNAQIQEDTAAGMQLVPLDVMT